MAGHGSGSGNWTGHGEDIFLPRLLQGLSSKGVVSVSAVDCHTGCVTTAGELFTWGEGWCGKLGHGDEREQQTPKPVEALVGVKTKMDSSGYNHTAVMYTFGKGRHGLLVSPWPSVNTTSF